ncbi:hypothetical protein KBX73_14945 [Acetobacter persici]|uniref:hypothetical protein n=1 Tax=Acetobacter persici TaxID=1076596 RepID=UPI001BA900DB|nr:hypothetical protein [Acetobacter persici]MBS1016870.1 hypothetical protein [Acetobacter persici]MCP9321041.1 hypothetical protein [Acetobacter persici]
MKRSFIIFGILFLTIVAVSVKYEHITIPFVMANSTYSPEADTAEDSSSESIRKREEKLDRLLASIGGDNVTAIDPLSNQSKEDFTPIAKGRCSIDVRILINTILPLRMHGIPIESAKNVFKNYNGSHYGFMISSVDSVYQDPELFRSQETIYNWERLCMHDIQGY